MRLLPRIFCFHNWKRQRRQWHYMFGVPEKVCTIYECTKCKATKTEIERA